MRAFARRRDCATAVLAAVLVGTTGLVAQDRPVYVVDTDPAPAQVEDGTFFLVGGLIATMVRNRHTAPVQVTLRAWVFDQAGRFKGTNVHCVAEWFDRGTRRLINAPLDVRDLASTDSVAVAIVRVIADRRERRAPGARPRPGRRPQAASRRAAHRGCAGDHLPL